MLTFLNDTIAAYTENAVPNNAYAFVLIVTLSMLVLLAQLAQLNAFKLSREFVRRTMALILPLLGSFAFIVLSWVYGFIQ